MVCINDLGLRVKKVNFEFRFDILNTRMLNMSAAKLFYWVMMGDSFSQIGLEASAEIVTNIHIMFCLY